MKTTITITHDEPEEVVCHLETLVHLIESDEISNHELMDGSYNTGDIYMELEE